MKENNIHKMIKRNVDRQLVREYLLKETERAGFGGLTFNRTPEGTKVTLQAEQVGRVIGRRGKVIHDLQRRLQDDFDLDNPPRACWDLSWRNPEPMRRLWQVD